MDDLVTRRVVQSTHVAAIVQFDAVVVLALDNPAVQTPLVLEGTARAIWERLSEPHSLDTLTLSIAEDFDTSASAISDHVQNFVQDLLDAAVLTQVDDK
ncbi:PqqD family protein [Paramicrobacterium chengjingii]|uniref:PqqD family protein n=1 Tax=Paramicrobacterium chengjingii TaxID=2769067 RepID=UPI0014237D73|nr:PqqD family protein [Microbacterium chengjingii]